MPSQKQSKRRRQAARTPSPPPVRTRGQRRASPRVLIGAAVVTLLIVVAVVLAVVLTGGSDSSSSGSAPKLPDAADVQQLFAGIPQNGNVLGKPSAPVTVIEYVDLQCPFCRQFETEAMPTILSNYVRKGKAKVEARVISFLGPDSQRGREAALAAAKQNKLFNFAQLLYDNQGTENTGWLNDDIIKSAAASIPGLDASRLESDRGSGSVKSQMSTMDSQAAEAHVNATPTIYVVHKGGKPQLVTLTGPGDPSALEAAINTSG
jgi:protein-disulfide isomerase